MSTTEEQIQAVVRERTREILDDDMIRKLVDAEIVRLTTPTRQPYGGAETKSPLATCVETETRKLITERLAQFVGEADFREKVAKHIAEYLTDEYRLGPVVHGLVSGMLDPILRVLQEKARGY